MLTKATAKFIKSLQLKKYRNQEQLFVVEGAKSVLEVLNSVYEVDMIVGTNRFFEDNQPLVKGLEVFEVAARELASLGTFQTNDGALAVVRIPPNLKPDTEKGWSIVLDGVNDPGNFGTIIRIADWYGISNIIASENTVDVYNQKVISASMGSFCRVTLFYTSLEEFLLKTKLPRYGAVMDGENLHQINFPKEGLLILGNEANGISLLVQKHLDKRVTIPQYGKAESLNVAMATAIMCDNLFRSISE